MSFLLDSNDLSIKTTSLQQLCWATPGFLRGIVCSNRVGTAFCSDKWMKLMIKLLDNSIKTSGPKPSWALKTEQQVSLSTVHLHNYTCTLIIMYYDNDIHRFVFSSKYGN